MTNPKNVSAYCIGRDATLRDAIACIDNGFRGIALVVTEERRLIGTITDGDVRRAILSGRGLDTAIELLVQHKQKPVTAPVDVDRESLIHLMKDLVIRQVPLVDSDDRVVDLVTIDDLIPEEPLQLQAVIMAGGFGTRLMPLTEQTPKPMLPIGDRPLMELTIDRLRDAGIRRVNITTHYQAEKIRSHFGDGEKFGVDVRYVDEDIPLGTAGALSLMQFGEEPLLVINGDILTQVDFRSFLQFHREHRADMTTAVRKYDIEVPYGVVECDGARVTRLTEKPQLSFFVNAGIYLLEPAVCNLIPSRRSFNMTDLIQELVNAGRQVVSFPIREYWIDIGRLADYELAQEYAKANAT